LHHASERHKEQIKQTIAGLERHMAALESIGNHQREIAACQAALSTLKELLTTTHF
jgi:hypothetical protein